MVYNNYNELSNQLSDGMNLRNITKFIKLHALKIMKPMDLGLYELRQYMDFLGVYQLQILMKKQDEQIMQELKKVESEIKRTR